MFKARVDHPNVLETAKKSAKGIALHVGFFLFLQKLLGVGRDVNIAQEALVDEQFVRTAGLSLDVVLLLGRQAVLNLK